MVQRLTSRGVAVRALVRRGLVAPPNGTQDARIEPVRGDVTDVESVRRATAGCEFVFHCAWGGDTLAEACRINVAGTRAVIEAAAAARVRRVVHLSTMAVHGQRDLPPILTEDAPLRFDGAAYAVSKAEGEVQAFARGRDLGVEVVALRPTLVYGPAAPLWVLGYCERVQAERVALVDGGSGLANLVYVEDLVDAMWLAATAPVAGEAFLISGARPITWREYLGRFADMCGKPPPPSVPAWRARLEMQWLRVYGTLAERPRRLQGMDIELMTQTTVVSIDKARCRLGYAPRIDTSEGMRRCESWLRQEGYLPPTRPSGVAAAPRAPQCADGDTPDRAAASA
jgi:nucleoside-diphosphate-sugar epimerase